MTEDERNLDLEVATLRDQVRELEGLLAAVAGTAPPTGFKKYAGELKPLLHMNEKLRITQDGQLLFVHNGEFWEFEPLSPVYESVEEATKLAGYWPLGLSDVGKEAP